MFKEVRWPYFALLRRIKIAFLFIALGLIPGDVLGEAHQDLTTVSAIRALTLEQARQGRPVHLRGVVTAHPGYKTSFFVQDSTAGISVEWLDKPPEVRVGQLVEIHGVTGPGLFAPLIIAKDVQILGKAQLPRSNMFRFDQLTGGSQDSQFLSIRGIVRSAVVKPMWGRQVLILELDLGDGNMVSARVRDFSESDLQRLPTSTVIVHGVCGTVFNNKRQFLGIRMYVESSDDLVIEQKAATAPFDLPLKSLDSLLQFREHSGTTVDRVKIRGTVTYSRPGQELYLQDKSAGILVHSGQMTAVALGSVVEAVGYPTIGRYSPELDDAIYRVVGAGAQLTGLPRSASSMIGDSEGAPAAPYDATLVTLKGRLIEEVSVVDGDLLVLQEGSSVFNARLPHSSARRPVLSPGSLLQVTGICAAMASDTHEPQSFEILLRGPADVVVLQAGPWWTAAHAVWIVASLILAVLGMMICLVIMRRQTALQELAVTDPLTDLYNRRGFLAFAQQQLHLASRKKACFLLFYLDVDRFKEINDSLGHQQGDVALRAIADILRHTFRKTDIVGRIGGDEFAIAAIDAPPGTKFMLEGRLEGVLQQYNERPQRALRLSLSIGVLQYDESHGDAPVEELLVKADALMYEQKRSHKEAYGSAGVLQD